MTYEQFIEEKSQLGGNHGFEPIWMPDGLFDFQRHLVTWACNKGRAALFADCGLGKTAMQLTWAENVARKTNGRVLVLTPLAVGAQTVREGEKFGVECYQSRDGSLPDGKKIIVTNYEKLHLFNAADFVGCVCDESSILKNFDGSTRAAITDFMRKHKFRLLCTATAAPNDFIELGTSSEAIGEMGFADMLSRFFKKEGAPTSRSDEHRANVWRFRGHAERDFWRWVCSWAMAVRRPSDIGFSDDLFVLPELVTREHVVYATKKKEGHLFDLPAVGLSEQREERRRTIDERCEMVAEIVSGTNQSAVCWCHLNDEGDTLEKMIQDSVQVSGKDNDDEKEEAFNAFVAGKIRVLITKSVVAGFGLNWQHCAHQTFFPSHSFEQWYQAVRRCWRFGQIRPVTIDMIASEGERGVLLNLKRKAEQADLMFANLVSSMENQLRIEKKNKSVNQERLPSWL